jgi:hypothetical protein
LAFQHVTDHDPGTSLDHEFRRRGTDAARRARDQSDFTVQAIHGCLHCLQPSSDRELERALGRKDTEFYVCVWAIKTNDGPVWVPPGLGRHLMTVPKMTVLIAKRFASVFLDLIR